ncbi:MAG: LacI family transcriptional regulator, partial [Hymenobacter sp.]
MPRRPSIADLARALNLSPSTVSRALADHSEVSETTRQRVQQLAQEMGYQPNQVAVALRKGRSNTLGVLVPHLTGSFFPEVVDGITEAASAAGYNVMICQSHDDARQERRSLELLLQAPVAGVLVSVASATHEFSHFEAVPAAGLPLVFFDRAVAGFTGPGISSVVLDDYAGAYAATAHLLAEGYRRVACFSGPQHLTIYQQRYQGYLQALRDHGLPHRPELVFHAEQPHQRTGAAHMHQLLALPGGPPDAIFSASDAAVVGALQVLKERGLRIPGDVALAGFSNAEFTAFTDPPLTTVDQCSQQMGREAVQQLLHGLAAHLLAALVHGG